MRFNVESPKAQERLMIFLFVTSYLLASLATSCIMHRRNVYATRFTRRLYLAMVARSWLNWGTCTLTIIFGYVRIYRGNLYLTELMWTLFNAVKSSKGRTPTPLKHASRASFDKERDTIASALKNAPQTHKMARRLVSSAALLLF